MVCVLELLAQIKDLQIKNCELQQDKSNLYLFFAMMLGQEIMRIYKLSPLELSVRIVDGCIILTAGKDDSFKLEFTSHYQMLQYLLITVKTISIEDGAAVAFGSKSHAEICLDLDKEVY